MPIKIYASKKIISTPCRWCDGTGVHTRIAGFVWLQKRKALEWPRWKMAEALGVSEILIQKIEAGTRRCTERVQAAYAALDEK